MWLIIALCVGSALGEFIQLGDKSFVDEDASLTAALKQRMSGHLPPPPPSNHTPDLFMYALRTHEMQQQYTETRRYRKPFPNQPGEPELRERVADLMRQHVYATQYRLRDLQYLIDKYGNDINFRMAFIYCRLETLIKDMHVLLTRVDVIMDDYYNKRPFLHHLYYYNYFFKKNVDVTYIVEHLIFIHTRHMAVLYPPTLSPGETLPTMSDLQEVPPEFFINPEDIPPQTSVQPYLPDEKDPGERPRGPLHPPGPGPPPKTPEPE